MACTQEKRQSVEIVPNEAQQWTLLDKDFKTAILNMFKKLKPYLKNGKSIGAVSHQVENISKEISVTKKNQIEMLERKPKASGGHWSRAPRALVLAHYVRRSTWLRSHVLLGAPTAAVSPCQQTLPPAAHGLPLHGCLAEPRIDHVLCGNVSRTIGGGICKDLGSRF